MTQQYMTHDSLNDVLGKFLKNVDISYVVPVALTTLFFIE